MSDLKILMSNLNPDASVEDRITEVKAQIAALEFLTDDGTLKQVDYFYWLAARVSIEHMKEDLARYERSL